MVTGGKRKQPERLSEKTLKDDAIVCSRQRKVLREIRSGFPAYTVRSKSNRTIDAKISFYGTYVQINEQVTLQNQDPRLNLA